MQCILKNLSTLLRVLWITIAMIPILGCASQTKYLNSLCPDALVK